MTRYVLSTAPDVPRDGSGDDRHANERAAYLTRRADLSENKALALAYRELGYSHSGIAKRCGVAESTVDGWMAEISDRHGRDALESRPQSNPTEGLR